MLIILKESNCEQPLSHTTVHNFAKNFNPFEQVMAVFRNKKVFSNRCFYCKSWEKRFYYVFFRDVKGNLNPLISLYQSICSAYQLERQTQQFMKVSIVDGLLPIISKLDLIQR